MLSQGSTMGEASRKIEVAEQTYCRWRREYGGIGEIKLKDKRGLRKRMPDSKDWWQISRWTMQSSRRLPGETPKPHRGDVRW